MLPFVNNLVLGAGSNPIESMLESIEGTLDTWFGSGTKIIGLIVLIIGIVALLSGIWSIHKGQPSVKSFIVALLALVIGGYMSFGGFKAFKNLSETTGQGSVDELLKNGGSGGK